MFVPVIVVSISRPHPGRMPVGIQWEVTRVFVVPGYNNSVIVRHGNYLTVYSNLSQVYVKAGDRVSHPSSDRKDLFGSGGR